MNTSPFTILRVGSLPFAAVGTGTNVPRIRERPRLSLGGLADEHDLVLLKQIAGGKTLALLELYDIHYEDVFHHAFRGHYDLECAEHAVMATFQTVWSRAAYFNPDATTVRSWLMTTATMFADRECVRYGLDYQSRDGR